MEKLLFQRDANFLCMRSRFLESVIVTEFQVTEAYSGLDVTKRKYSISRLPVYPQKLASTLPTSGCLSFGIVRSRTQATEFFHVLLLFIPEMSAGFTSYVVPIIPLYFT
jgi:hypothetical protein